MSGSTGSSPVCEAGRTTTDRPVTLTAWRPWLAAAYGQMAGTTPPGVTTAGDTGVQHEGEPGKPSASISTYSGTGTFWPPVPPQATQLRMTVGTLREAAWALIDIPGRQPRPRRNGSDPAANPASANAEGTATRTEPSRSAAYPWLRSDGTGQRTYKPWQATARQGFRKLRTDRSNRPENSVHRRAEMWSRVERGCEPPQIKMPHSRLASITHPVTFALPTQRDMGPPRR